MLIGVVVVVVVGMVWWGVEVEVRRWHRRLSGCLRRIKLLRWREFREGGLRLLVRLQDRMV